MHQISLGLSLNRGAASAFPAMSILTARNGDILTNAAGVMLTAVTP